MLDLFKDLGALLVTVFVVTSMFNVGLTQKPSKILHHLQSRRFLIAMVLSNLVVVPALMVFATELVTLAPHYEAGLIVFGLAAGAPFLIKLTQVSEHDVALGATVLMVLMVATVVTMPLLLPALIEGISVDAFAIVKALVIQMIGPMIAGMVLAQVAESFDALIQPWVAKISNIALYGLIVAILIGYSPQLLDPDLWVALGVGAVVLLLAFFVGYEMGDGHDHLKDVGGLGTAQRGTAAALIVAGQNFDDPRVLVVITILNTLGVVILILAAKRLSADNTFDPLTPTAADTPRRRDAVGSGSTRHQAS